MSEKNRTLFYCIILTALIFGFMHHFFVGIHFERLHIFLLNLCAGGTLIIYFTEGSVNFTRKTTIFFISSFLYAIFAFLEKYEAAIFISIVMFFVVESVRIKRFGFFPKQFFLGKYKMSEKFHHASLLCLSIGLLLSSFAIINHKYFQLLPFRKFELNTFFLGFSFPVSLITLSIIFSIMQKAPSGFQKFLKILSFWVINVGVVVFFIFILFESPILEIIISSTLFIMVFIVFILYYLLGYKEQRKLFLSSGIAFLNFTAVTGIAYILLYLTNFNTLENAKLIKDIHRIVSLYGWNLTGLSVILRFRDFPISLNSSVIIALHWITVAILIPLGYYLPIFSLIATISFAVFLYVILFSKSMKNV